MPVRIICGANEPPEGAVDVAGKTVAEVKQAYRDVLNIPDDANAIISGDNVENTYTLRDGDVLEFVRKSGEKGK